jgi:hypothetical protein
MNSLFSASHEGGKAAHSCNSADSEPATAPLLLVPKIFGTRLGEAGFDVFTIASLMGHSQIQTTARYVRATERNKREAVEAVMLASESGHKLNTTQKRPVSLAM